jgi:hypothetical protein
MPVKLHFQPLSFSWVALHPDARGVILFIGGAGFGSLPTLFYRYFLSQVFAQGYTIVALPFRFSFRHWSIAISLLEEQRLLSRLLTEAALKADYPHDLYQEASNYFWVGHSLGCKYIELLELLSGKEWRENVAACTDRATVEWLADRLPDGCAIRDQRSLLIAPDISDTASAIPIPAIARLLDRLNLGVRPGRNQTKCLIRRCQLFNLTAMISFDHDRVAGSINAPPEPDNDVRWIFEELQRQRLIHRELTGKHLEPIGIKVGNSIVDLNLFDKFIKPLSRWQLDAVVLEFLEKLEHR